MTVLPIGEEALEAARARFGGLGPVGAGLAEASRPLGHLHDRLGAQLAIDRTLLTGGEGIATLRTTLPGSDPRVVEALWQAVAEAGPLRAAMQVVMDRALDPLAGLATYPESVLFSPLELAALAEMEAEPQFPPSQLRGAVTGIVKVTRHCNLRCTYCHDWRTGREAAMPFAVLARTMRWLTADANARRIHVVLHGGEPSLLGPTGLIKLLALQARYRGPGVTVLTRMQTNGLRLKPALVDVLVRYGIVSSVSLDGPPEVHDKTRLTVGGMGSSQIVREAIARLRAAGVLNGVLMVVSPALVKAGAVRLVQWLQNEGISAIALLPMRPAAGQVPSAEDTLPTETFCRFLLDVEVARRRYFSTLSVREIDAAQAALAGDEAPTCELQGFCVGHYFSIEPDGSISHCDKFLGDADYRLGTIWDRFETVARGEPARRLMAKTHAASQAKRDCAWWQHCRGWCPHEDYVAKGLHGDGRCCGLSPLFEGLDAVMAGAEPNHVTG
ncbi:radical SAM protein (plasmid) [Sphingobium sp. SJ10-10]|uniref:radical SAM/SPASM domain-containing protein n=1 Tax=Sphingobium sp. SJ10-10 TaxID=3114999 RepID=UPI002E16B78B|nr:radical SAM protein [Sphingobium sp. SJ10-10]